MWKKIGLSLLLLVLVTAQFGFMGTKHNVAEAADNGLAQKPYMGWSSYSMQVYDGPQGNWISEQKIKAMSDAMHEKLQSHGYEYINIDAGWNGSMDEYARPIPSTTLYPSGFQSLIDYVHHNGQKIGIYLIPGMSKDAYAQNLPIYGTEYHMQDIAALPLRQSDYWDIGYKIDFTKPGAQEYVNSIADLIASWGIDFVKFDSVTPGSGHNDTSIDARGDVAAWSAALSKHHIWYELSWALDHNYVDLWKQYANGWRVDWDVESYDKNIGLTQWANIARLFPDAALWWRDAGPGGWNDFDSLNVGNGSMDGLTKDERQTAMTLWAMSSAQLYTGNDLTNLDSYGLQLLTNDEVIAVNQAGHPAHPVSMDTQQQVWYANNGDGTYNVGLFNLGNRSAAVNVKWSDIGLDGPATVRDLWSHTELGTFDTGISGEVLEPHASRMFKVTAKSGTSAVNDDDTGIHYTGSWLRNGGKEQVPGMQDLSMTIGDSTGDVTEPAPEDGDSSGNPPDNNPSVTHSVYINDSDSGIVYSGSWNHSTGRSVGDYKADVHYTENNGDYAEYTFTGTGIDLLTEKDSSQGDMLVYLDGATSPQTISTFTAGVKEAQQTVYSISGLPAGEHTIKVVKDSGQYMLLDAFKVTTDSLITPDSGTFDKMIGNQADLVTSLVLGSGSLVEVRNGVTPLIKDTDYTVVGNTVVIKKGYLFNRPSGQTDLTFLFDGGSTQLLSIQVGSSSTQNSSIDPVMSSFDKASAHQQDITIGMTLNGNTLSGIENNGISLSVEDYTVDSSNVTIKKEYLAKQPLGTTRLSFVFSTGDPQTLDIHISNSVTVRYTAINNDDSAITYNGSWSRSSGRGMGDYKDDVQFTEKNGDSFSYNFRGTGIQLFTEIDTSQGDMDIFIDDQFQETVSAYHNGRLAQQNLYSITGLPEGLHTLKAVKKSGDYMLLDMLKVEIPDLINPVEASFDKKITAQADVQVTLLQQPGMFAGISNGSYQLVSGTDYTLEGTLVTLNKAYLAAQPLGTLHLTFNFKGDYQNDVHYTLTDGDYLEYSFKGTGISLISPKGPAQGDMDIYVDGVLKQRVNANSSSRQILQNLYSITGLSDGVHILKAVKVSGELMLADQLKFTIAASDSGSTVPSNPSGTPTAVSTPAPTAVVGTVATPAPATEENTPEVTQHSAYINGYPGGLFKPDNKITRAEIAAVLASTAAKEANGTLAVFSDVDPDFWAAEAITKVAKMGLMNGYKDGTFKPNQPLTRAEMASLVAALSPESSSMGRGFTDIAGNWAQKAIIKAQGAGILNGYADGTFRPGNQLTRAEAVVAMNRVLGRGPLNGRSESQWADVPTSHWAFKDIEEASSDHAYKLGAEGTEQWVDVTKED
ncbi:X2-like carbohydrate binding domain-containing protein [Paenibacillus monticola]|nr:X2-like carbohydrate binding domain-containing protein [Paenibacillus monticola]